jgi:hypothetical protein
MRKGIEGKFFVLPYSTIKELGHKVQKIIIMECRGFMIKNDLRKGKAAHRLVGIKWILL